MLTSNEALKKKSVLVYGATGGVGMATIQLARALGASVLTTVSGSGKRRFAEELGADFVIDRTSENVAEAAVKFSRGGVDLVVDHVGAATWQTSVSALKRGGRMAVCGMTSGNDATMQVRAFYSKQIIMTGALMGTKRQVQQLVRFVVRNKIKPVIDSQMPLEKAGEAHRRMEKSLHMGKILIDCR